jgi:glycosyltransferase involved in cell wall biosynthesis
VVEGVPLASDRTDEAGARRRVLRVITRLNVGGPATHVVLADRGLAALGWETLLVHGMVEPSEAEIGLASVDVPLHRLDSLARPISPVADARSLFALARLIRRYRPHVIHTHLSKAGLVGRAAAIASSRAVRVHTFHGNVFGGYFGPRMSAAILAAERLLGRATHRIVALSERQRAELLALGIGSPGRIRIVPLGVDLARYRGHERAASRAALGIPADALVVLALGRMVPIKRLDRLVEAVARLAPDVPSLHLFLVGDGDERSALETLVRDRGLTGRVTFAGWSADAPAWYSAADVITLTSEREGTPLALIEAAASGRPVVAVDVGGVADVVRDGETGFVVPPDDTAALADRLAVLLRDPALRARMAAAAPGRASAFDADRLVSDLDRLYRDALGDGRIHESATA